MSKLSAVSRGYLIKRLRQLGFQGPYQGGKHPYMKADVSREEWLEEEND